MQEAVSGTLFFIAITLHPGNTHSLGVEGGRCSGRCQGRAPPSRQKTPRECWGTLEMDQILRCCALARFITGSSRRASLCPCELGSDRRGRGSIPTIQEVIHQKDSKNCDLLRLSGFSLKPHSARGSNCCCHPYVAGKETEAQSSSVTCLRSHSC